MTNFLTVEDSLQLAAGSFKPAKLKSPIFHSDYSGLVQIQPKQTHSPTQVESLQKGVFISFISEYQFLCQGRTPLALTTDVLQ
jgi:hypothetical protein